MSSTLPKLNNWWFHILDVVSIRTYSECSQRSTQEPKRDPSGPEGTARTSQATDQRPTVRSQTPALS
jgi:hypothetical protein